MTEALESENQSFESEEKLDIEGIPRKSEIKRENIEEINMLLSYFASEYKMGVSRVKNIFKSIVADYYWQKRGKKVITININEGYVYVYKPIYEGELPNEKNVKKEMMSAEVCTCLRRNFVDMLMKTAEENVYKKEKTLLESIIKNDLRGNSIVRVKLIVFVKKENKYALRFENKEGEQKGHIFLMSKNSFLDTDEIKGGNVFYVRVFGVEYDEKNKKIIALKATRRDKGVFEAEFKNIFRKILAKKREGGEYGDSVLNIVQSSVLKCKVDNMGNITCIVDDKGSRGVSLFFFELARIYNSRFQRTLKYKIVRK